MWRSAVQLRAGLRYGGIAQLVEHLLCKQGVKSSNLFISTKNRSIDFFGWPILFLWCSKRRRFRYQMPHSKKVCNANQIFQLYQGIDISTKRGRLKTSFFCEVRSPAAAAASKHPPIAQRAPPVATVKLGNAYQFEKFGTGNSLLRYGIYVPVLSWFRLTRVYRLLLV